MTRKAWLLAGALALAPLAAHAQSQPNWALGYVPSPAEWNGWWAKKLDYGTGLTGGQIKLGNVGMINSQPLLSGVENQGTIVSISPNAGNALIAGTRTSDGGSTGAQGAWAIGSFTFNDNATAVQTSYGEYVEARRVNGGAGITQGIEIDMVNQGAPSATINPATNLAQPGSTLGLWLSSGRPDLSSQQNTLAIGVINNGSQWQMGLAFGRDSIATITGLGAPAITMTTGQFVAWYGNDANINSLIRSDNTAVTGARPAAMVFGQTGGYLISSGGSNSGTELTWVTDLVQIKNLTVTGALVAQGKLSAGALGAYANDSAAAANGVNIGDLYVWPDGSVHRRVS